MLRRNRATATQILALTAAALLLSLADIGAFLGAPTANRVAIDEVVAWRGLPELPDLLCVSGGGHAPGARFRVGVDGNCVLQGERSDRGVFASGQRVDPLQLFATHGVNAFRVRLWVGDEGESKLHYATNLRGR
jgi:hypothetical protein